ncbi:FAD dependent oxidoreductase-domain-containing protein [Gautieria morchelliformis]|nr:FAD dependent oxidoreductase-domain-containing protein [Gautieria morchelliformis]
MELDYEQYKLVREALHERRIFLQTAPYLSSMLPIMLPVYKYWQVPYYWAGCKMYDILAGGENMESSYLMSKGKALDAFPMLKGDGLVGAVVYYDGQHNDSRMNIALIMTAVQEGAVVANHVEVTDLLKSDNNGKLYGARVRDTLTGQIWNVRAKGVINATGPFTDTLLSLDNPDHKPIVQPSSGVHVTLPNYYSPRTMGLLDPATSDGRVIFFLPWQGNTIAGTTDSKAPVEVEPRAREEEIRWVLEEIRRYLSPDIKVRRGDVLSAWSGLRPLVSNPDADATEGLVRNHMIHVSPSGLLTIAGGKWTTYRAMAQETVDRAVEEFALEDRVKSPCITDTLRLIGSQGWSQNMFIGLIQRYGLETEVAKHLADNYGDRAWTVLERWPLHGIRITPLYPYIEAEIRYAVRNEYAQTAVDFIARRCRLSFLNAQAALEALPRVIDVMAGELSWTPARKREELRRGVEFLRSMGLRGVPDHALEPIGWVEWFGSRLTGRTPPPIATRYSRAQFEAGELDKLKAAFLARATSLHEGEEASGGEKRLHRNQLQQMLGGLPGYEETKPQHLDNVLTEIGFEGRDDIALDEFLEICAGLKELFAAPTLRASKAERRKIPVEKSGGGV